MGVLKGLFQSRKFWLTVAACVTAAANGLYTTIPWIIMTNAGLIAAEDVAKKLKVE